MHTIAALMMVFSTFALADDVIEKPKETKQRPRYYYYEEELYSIPTEPSRDRTPREASRHESPPRPEPMERGERYRHPSERDWRLSISRRYDRIEPREPSKADLQYEERHRLIKIAERLQVLLADIRGGLVDLVGLKDSEDKPRFPELTAIRAAADHTIRYCSTKNPDQAAVQFAAVRLQTQIDAAWDLLNKLARREDFGKAAREVLGLYDRLGDDIDTRAVREAVEQDEAAFQKHLESVGFIKRVTQ
ncbi:MAG: hypothetical protein HYR96_01010 [Deltaproteobacteria bacterium]|nr:hypothetical protein [Deltaproteobacteria bacterium]MBI3293423.1 hypothetical protein [Deltaproteobacteria bacterium]